MCYKSFPAMNFIYMLKNLFFIIQVHPVREFLIEIEFNGQVTEYLQGRKSIPSVEQIPPMFASTKYGVSVTFSLLRIRTAIVTASAATE